MEAPRKPYSGVYRKLVLAFDIGTTYSGISYSVLDPGQIPEIKGVTRFPSQVAGGDLKIPSILYYDPQGIVKAIGAEAVQPSVVDQAEDEGWVKVEWFKLHLLPETMTSLLNKDGISSIPALPNIPDKSICDILGDFLQYLHKCAEAYMKELPAIGPIVWNSFQGRIEYIFTHPNDWGGFQQSQMRRAAVLAKLIPDTHDGHNRISFVTEGEASLHFCIRNGIGQDSNTVGKGIIIVDAGGGTIDLSAYALCQSGGYEEISMSECRLQGSIFVTQQANAYLTVKFRRSRFAEDVKYMANIFDQTTKLKFRDPNEPSFIKFGSAHDTDAKLGIRSGQLKLAGTTVAEFFEPSIVAILAAINEQLKHSHGLITTVLLVGGFAANDWLFSQLRSRLHLLDIGLQRPETLAGKAVADGAVSFYLDHYVSVRISKFSYGSPSGRQLNLTDPEHAKRAQFSKMTLSGVLYFSPAYSEILAKGTRVSETTQFRRKFAQEFPLTQDLDTIEADVVQYKGDLICPQWMDVEPEMFSKLCTIRGDVSRASKPLHDSSADQQESYYRFEFTLILFFGLTELKAQLSWMEQGKEIRSPAHIIYDEGLTASLTQSQDRMAQPVPLPIEHLPVGSETPIPTKQQHSRLCEKLRAPFFRNRNIF